MKKLIIIGLAIVMGLLILPNLAYAKGSSGGGRSSGGSRSSTSSRTSTSTSTTKSTSGTSTTTTNKSNTRTATSSTTKPGSKVTAGGKTVQTSAKKPTNSKYTKQAGITGVDGYSPRFRNGYSAPAGSVVYYPQHSFIDYLPWIYLFSQSSPANDSATIVQPDGKEVVAQPEPEGVDGMAVFNWIILILLGVGLIAGVIYLVNKWTDN
jgi:hypothetical protein